MMVIYLPVKFEFDWTNRFRVKSPEMKNVDGQADRQTDGHQTHQSYRQVSYTQPACSSKLSSIL